MLREAIGFAQPTAVKPAASKGAGQLIDRLPPEVWTGEIRASYGGEHGDLLHADPRLGRALLADCNQPRWSLTSNGPVE